MQQPDAVACREADREVERDAEREPDPAAAGERGRPPAPQGYEWVTPESWEERRSAASGSRVFGWILMVGTVVVGGCVLFATVLMGFVFVADTGAWSPVLSRVALILVCGVVLFFLGMHMTVYARRCRWQMAFAAETGLIPAVKARWDFVVSLGTFGAMLGALPLEGAVKWALRAVQDPEKTVSPLVLLVAVGIPVLYMGAMVLLTRWGIRRQRRCPPLSGQDLAAVAPPPWLVAGSVGLEFGAAAGLLDAVGD